jgi:glycosyltransferase involved in cell wall biosynthesis
VAAVALGRLLRLPVVITEHVLWKPWLETRPFVRRQAVWAAGRAAARVAVSDATRATMHSFLPERPSIDVIPVGVDGDVFHVKESRAEWPDDRILFVGWVNYVKGVDVLIDSMAVLVRRRPRVRLTVVGGALFRDKQRQEDELLRRVRAGGFNSHVVFAGPQTAEGVARFMRESDVLVLPSRRESCGAVLLEALACGTPVVATRCGGPEEIVTEEVGVLTDVEGPAALADAIERVLDRRHVYDPSRLREYVLARYSWNRLADAYLDVYRAVLRNRHRSCRA